MGIVDIDMVFPLYELSGVFLNRRLLRQCTGIADIYVFFLLNDFFFGAFLNLWHHWQCIGIAHTHMVFRRNVHSGAFSDWI